MGHLLIGWLACLLLAIPVAGHAEVAVPPVARVTDLTSTLSGEALAALDAKAADLETRKGSQVAVLVVPTTAPETIEQYALRVATTWKLGRKGVDDGALLVVAKDDRALRIEVGYGLEGALSDAISKRIVSDVIVPRLREGDFPGGITAGLDAIVGVIDGEPLPAPKARARDGARPQGLFQNLEGLLVVGFIGVVVIGGILRKLIGRVPAALTVGAGAGAIGWAIGGALLIGGIVAVIAFVFTLAGGAASGMRGGRGGRGGWSGGGGGFGGGGGGGGFGGGGGGFGGGGASGRW